VLIRILLLFALLEAPGFHPAFSHEGHSHGDEPAPPAAAAPRAEAHSELFEIVAVLGPDRRLWLYLDRHATSEPIDGATVQITLDGEDLGTATRAGEAIYVLANPALERPGQKNLVFTITAGEDMDLLPATLDLESESALLFPRTPPQPLIPAWHPRQRRNLALSKYPTPQSWAASHVALPPVVMETGPL
jgi:hypothetical protein